MEWYLNIRFPQASYITPAYPVLYCIVFGFTSDTGHLLYILLVIYTTPHKKCLFLVSHWCQRLVSLSLHFS